jgi:hypothetical protein
VDYINLTLDLTFSSSEIMSENMYLEWFDHSQSLKALGTGLSIYPSSTLLWSKRISLSTSPPETLVLFQKATCTTNSIDIWKMYVEFGCREAKYVDCKVIFEDAIKAGMSQVVESYMRFVSKKGIEEVRRVAGKSDQIGVRRLLVEIEEGCEKCDLREVKMGYEWLHNRVPEDTGNVVWIDFRFMD